MMHIVRMSMVQRQNLLHNPILVRLGWNKMMT